MLHWVKCEIWERIENISDSLCRNRPCRDRRWKEGMLMTEIRQKRYKTETETLCGRLVEWKRCNVHCHLSRGNSSSHLLSVQNTLLLTYFPFHGALISLPRIHLVTSTSHAWKGVCRLNSNKLYSLEQPVELWHFYRSTKHWFTDAGALHICSARKWVIGLYRIL